MTEFNRGSQKWVTISRFKVNFNDKFPIDFEEKMGLKECLVW